MKFGSSFTIIVFFCFMALGFSCIRNNKQGAENVVYYYPEKNIYFDGRQSIFYYSLDSTRSWDSLAFTGPGYGTVLGPRMAIKRKEINVWVNNESDRKEYKGVLLNIINNRTISISKSDSIKKLNAVKKVNTRPEVIEKEPPAEKGLKKFFNKLFGKKKKPAEEKKQ